MLADTALTGRHTDTKPGLMRCKDRCLHKKIRNGEQLVKVLARRDRRGQTS